RAENRRAGTDHIAFDAVASEPDRADDAILVAQEIDDRAILEDIDARPEHGLAQRQRHVGPDHVERDENARTAMVAARREVIAPFTAAELRADLPELAQARGRLVDERADERAVVDPTAADDRILVMEFGIV